MHRPHSALKRLRDDDLLDKGLEIGKRFARAAGARDLPISDTQSGKQVPGATPLIACLPPLWLAALRRARRLFPFPSLDRGFLIQQVQLRSIAIPSQRSYDQL